MNVKNNINNNEKVEPLKIVLIGESGVGKTSIIYQFIDKSFLYDQQTTIGGTFATKKVKCSNGKILKLEIWDTAGQEKYRSVTKMFYKDADAAILVYDITSKNSFEEIKNYWIKEVKELCNKNVILAIVGNNSDLFEREQVNEEEARKLAEDLGAIFVTNTFRSPESINYLFLEIAKKYTECSEVAFIEKDDIGRFQYFHTIITKKLSKWKNY
jgi:small GTP-binding protein